MDWRGTLSNTRLRTTAALVISGGMAALLGYVWTLLTGRLLPAGEYSDFTAGASIIYFAVTALTPASQTLAFFTATSIENGRALEKRLLQLLWLCGFALIAITAAVAIPLAPLLHFRSPIVLVFIAASIVVVFGLHVRRGTLLGEQRFERYAVNLVVEAILRLTMAAVALYVLANAPVSLAAYATAGVAAMSLFPHTRAEGEANLGAALRYFAPTFAYTIVYAALQNADVILVKQWFPRDDAGLYGAASFLARATGMLVMPFVAFAVPHLVEAAADRAEVRRRFTRICLEYAALSVAALLVVAFAGERIVILILGSGYAAAGPLLLPLSTAFALSGSVFLLCQLPVAMNRFRFVGWYALGLAIDLGGLILFHRTLMQVACVLIAANLIALLLVAPHLRSDQRSPQM